MRIEIVTAGFDPHAFLADFARGRDDHGAVASFIGHCRTESHGSKVEALELEHYPGFTETQIERIAGDAARKHGLLDVLVVHRVGRIAPGEPIVLVAALSAHRAGAFKAVEELMDYLKTDAPFWKHEITVDGACWVEPTDLDRARRAAHGGKP